MNRNTKESKWKLQSC